MRIDLLAVSAAALALAACGGEPADPADGSAAPGNDVLNMAPPPAGNQAAPAPAEPITADDGPEYVALVAAGDLYEIESARLAIEKSQDSAVRELAQMILTDHERSTSQLRTAAAQAQPPIDVAPELNPEQQANLDALRAADGPAFDPAWLTQQVRAHEQALGLVTAFADGGDVPALRQHASTVAAPIQRHLSRARTLVEQAALP